jgi:hypothetical protein
MNMWYKLGCRRRNAFAYTCPNFRHQYRTAPYVSLTPRSAISASTSR